MTFAEYVCFAFSWNVLMSVDVVLRMGSPRDLPMQWSWTLLMIIGNVSLLQFVLPVIGYVYLFKDVPPEQRNLGVWFAIVISAASASVVFSYVHLLLHRFRLAARFLYSVLCAGTLICAFTLGFAARRDEAMLDARESTVAIVLLLSYGMVCLKRIRIVELKLRRG